MTSVAMLIGAIVALGGAYVVAPVMLEAYRQFRGRRVVTCPETHEFAGVSLDAGRAALTAVFGAPEIRLASCSRWPERAGCGQPCLRQLESAPDGCLVQTLLARWYEDKRCALCGAAFGAINAWGHNAALLSPERRTMEWPDVPAERLGDVLATHHPICSNCHINETFRRMYPELVIDLPEDTRPRARSPRPT